MHMYFPAIMNGCRNIIKLNRGMRHEIRFIMVGK